MYTPTSNKRKLVSAHFSGEAIKDTAIGLSTSTIARGVFSGSSEPTMAFGNFNDNDSASFSISTLPTPNMHADDRPSTQAIDGQLQHRDLSRTESNQVSSRNFGNASSTPMEVHRPWARKDDLGQETVSTEDCVLSSPPTPRTTNEPTVSRCQCTRLCNEELNTMAPDSTTFTVFGIPVLSLCDYAPRITRFDPATGRLRSRSRNILRPPGPVQVFTSLKRDPIAPPPSNEPPPKRRRTDDVSPFAKQTAVSPDERIVPSLARCFVCSTRLTRKEHGGSRYPRCTKKECKTPVTPFEQRKLDRVKTNTWSSTHCHPRNSRSKGQRMTRKTVIEIKARKDLILRRASSRYRRFGSRGERKDKRGRLERLWPIVTAFDALPIETVIEEPAGLQPSLEPTIVDTTIIADDFLLPTVGASVVSSATIADNKPLPTLDLDCGPAATVPTSPSTTVESVTHPSPLNPATADNCDYSSAEPDEETVTEKSNVGVGTTIEASSPVLLGSKWIHDVARHPNVPAVRRSCRARRKPVRYAPS